MSHESFFIVLLALNLAAILYPQIMVIPVLLLFLAIRRENTRVFHALDATSASFI